LFSRSIIACATLISVSSGGVVGALAVRKILCCTDILKLEGPCLPPSLTWVR